MKFFALLAVANAISIQGVPGMEPVPAADLLKEASANPTISDPTGTYSPKANMWTGFEGTKTGKSPSFTYSSTGGHASVVRTISNSNHNNAVNEGGSLQRAN